MGKFEQAIACYDNAFKIDRNNVAALNRKGEALEAIGKHEESNKYFDMVGEIYNSKVVALNGEIDALLNDRKYHAAIIKCNQAD